MPKQPDGGLRLLSIVLWVVCLIIPNFSGSGWGGGAFTLAFGWLGMFTLSLGALGNLGWMANPLLVVSWLAPIKPTGFGVVLAALSAGLSFMPLLFNGTPDESGMPHPFHLLNPIVPAYLVWISACMVNLVRFICIPESDSESPDVE